MAEAMKDAIGAVEDWSDEQADKERSLLREMEAECSKPQEEKLDAMLKAHQRALEKAQ